MIMQRLLVCKLLYIALTLQTLFEGELLDHWVGFDMGTQKVIFFSFNLSKLASVASHKQCILKRVCLLGASNKFAGLSLLSPAAIPFKLDSACCCCCSYIECSCCLHSDKSKANDNKWMNSTLSFSQATSIKTMSTLKCQYRKREREGMYWIETWLQRTHASANSKGFEDKQYPYDKSVVGVAFNHACTVMPTIIDSLL